MPKVCFVHDDAYVFSMTNCDGAFVDTDPIEITDEQFDRWERIEAEYQQMQNEIKEELERQYPTPSRIKKKSRNRQVYKKEE